MVETARTRRVQRELSARRGQGTQLVAGLLSVSLVPAGQRRLSQDPLNPRLLRLVPGIQPTQTVHALESSSKVPISHVNCMQLPEELRGT